MSARFTTNFLVLLLGAALLVVAFAFAHATTSWTAVGAGAAAVLAAAYNFAQPDQGGYQRIADIVIAAVGAWAIVAARIMTYGGRWLVVGAALGLAALGAIGLVVREAQLRRSAGLGPSRVELERRAHLDTVPADGGVRS